MGIVFESFIMLNVGMVYASKGEDMPDKVKMVVQDFCRNQPPYNYNMGPSDVEHILECVKQIHKIEQKKPGAGISGGD